MRFLLNLLSPAPHIEKLKDPEAIRSNYNYWKWRIFIGMYIGYALFYFTRKSFTFLMPAMVSTFGFTKAQVGLLGSLLYVSYGASKFFSGIIADRSNPRFFMALGLILTGVCNIFFGFSSSFILFAVFLICNGFFQGWGWPPCAKLLMHWYPQVERGRWWGIWNSSHNVGGAITPLIVANMVLAYHWRYGMFIPASIAIAGGIFLLFCLRDTPQSLGLPPADEYKKSQQNEPMLEEQEEAAINAASDESEQQLTTKEILIKYVLTNRFIWILAISYFFIYVIRTAVNDWGQFFLLEGKALNYGASGQGIFWFEIGGIFGSLAAGWFSDKIFGGKRGPINVLFSLLVVFALVFLWQVPAGHAFLAKIAMFAIGFLIFGPQMLIGIAAAELSHKKAAATATGFAGWFGYAGAAASSYFSGIITHSFGWQGFFMSMGICGVISVMLLLPLWSVQANPRNALQT